MKHWNKSHKARKLHWHHVKTGPRIYTTTQLAEIKKWCWDHSSEGRFYYGPYSGWWFECKQDAAWFVLKWGPTVGL